jgi:hypothetical protein
MATWKKVIVSGSTANLAALQVDNLTSGQVVIGGGTGGNLSTTAINGTGNIVATTGATVNMSGSFSGSFVGNGAGLTGVTATAVFPTTQVTNIVSQDKFFISQSTGQEFITYGNLLNDLAGTNLVTESNDSLTLAAQISVTGVTASFLGNLTGTASFATYATNAGTAATSSFVLNAVSASYATFAATATSASFATNAATATSASFATNAATATSASFATQAANASNATTAVTSISASITDITTGGIHFLVFTTGSTGNQSLRVDSNGPTVNVTQNSISASSFTGSLLGTATTASYVLNAVSASFATTAASATSASYATFAATATSASFATQAANASTASFATAVGSIAANVTNNTDNRVLTATGGSTINGEGNLTFDGTTLTVTGNEVVTGNLTVQGTASFQNTTNLEVADRFVLFASGSNTAGDGGIVVQQGIQNVGELFGYENSVNRWGFTSSFNAGSPSYTAAAFVTTTETSISVPSAAPVYGGASNGFGNIHVKTDTGDIYIYA